MNSLAIINSVLTVAVLGGTSRLLVQWGKIEAQIDYIVRTVEMLDARLTWLEREGKV